MTDGRRMAAGGYIIDAGIRLVVGGGGEASDVRWDGVDCAAGLWGEGRG
jgi:hypothetical protein